MNSIRKIKTASVVLFWIALILGTSKYLIQTYLGPCQRSMIELLFQKSLTPENILLFLGKSFIVDVWQGSLYLCACKYMIIFPKFLRQQNQILSCVKRRKFILFWCWSLIKSAVWAENTARAFEQFSKRVCNLAISLVTKDSPATKR